MMSSNYVIRGPKGFTDFEKRSFTKIIFDSLKENGERVAFIDETTEEKITHEELLKKSLGLAIAFQKLGIKKGDIICILLENHVNYIIPFISSLFCGITAHPTNPDYTDYELKHILHLSKPKVIISSNYTLLKAIEARSKFDFVKTIINIDACNQEEILNMDDLIHLYMNEGESFRLEEYDDAIQDGVIINSSGTTGLPKGVLLTHMNLKCAMNVTKHSDYILTNNQDVIPFYLPFFHVFGLLMFTLIITSGATAIVFRKYSLTQVLKAVEKYHVKKLFIVPSIALQLSTSELIEDYDLSSLKHIFCGSAPLGTEAEKRFEDRFGSKIRQMYGLSELGAGAVCVEGEKLSSTVGRLVPACSAKVLYINTNMPLPPFKTGELCFKGATVMKGYYQNPDATKKAIDEDGYLHTGDFGYYDEEGNLFVVDRLKDIIKYKGWQVSPTEIENLIKSHTDINDAAVIGIPNELAGEVAMAFVVREPNSGITDLEIVKFVSDNLTVPKRLHGGVVFVDAIPKNGIGKVVRSQLKEKLDCGGKMV